MTINTTPAQALDESAAAGTMRPTEPLAGFDNRTGQRDDVTTSRFDKRRNFIGRRKIFSAIAGSVLAAGASAIFGSRTAQALPAGAKVLVVYFSRTGNTRVIAHQIRRTLGADIFEIEPANAYPEDYETTVAQAERERLSGFEPPLMARVPDIQSYEVVFLGFPVWGMTAPSIVRTFLSTHDLADKSLVPFITHGGYGRGQSIKVLEKHAPRARIREAFIMQAPQERQTLAQVSRWLGGVNPRRAPA